MLRPKKVYLIPPRYKKSTHLNIQNMRRQNQVQKQTFIDEDLISIVDRTCSGKFSQLIKRKQYKKQKKQQDILTQDFSSNQSQKKKRSYEKEQDLSSTRSKILTRCGFRKPSQPIPFFTIDRKNLKRLQKKSNSLQLNKKLLSSIFKEKRQHPYSSISERMSMQVVERKRKSTEILNFSPFGNIQPIQGQKQD